jgi:hypothetical protein
VKLRQRISPEDLKVPDVVLQLNGRDIPFVNNVTYLAVAFDRRMTWGHHIESTVAKVLRTYVKTYSLFRSGHLSTNIKLMLYKALSLFHLGTCGARSPFEIPAPAEQSTPLLEILIGEHQSTNST